MTKKNENSDGANKIIVRGARTHPTGIAQPNAHRISYGARILQYKI